MKKILRKRNGFTLIEILTSLVVLIVLGGVFYTVFFTNWFAFEDRIARTQMWHEANEIVDVLTTDARFAQTIDVLADGTGNKTAVLNDSFDQPIAVYIITTDGRFQMDKNGIVKTLSENINANTSDFIKQGRGLRLQLALQQLIFKRNINIETTTEVFPRN